MGLLDIIDIVGTISCGFFGLLSFLTWGLHFEWIQGFFAEIHHLAFGTPNPVVEYSLSATAGGIFALGVAALNLNSLFKGGLKNESEGYKAARQDVNFAFILGFGIAYSLASLDSSTWPDITGSLGATILWISFPVVMALGYATIFKRTWGEIRGPMGNRLFKEPLDDKFDAFHSFLFVFYGLAMFLTMSLHLGFMQNIMPSFMTLFGLLDPTPGPFAYDLATFGGGCFALGMAALNLPAFCGAQENAEYAKARKLADTWFWVGNAAAFSKFPDNGSMFWVWPTVAVVFVTFLNKKEGRSGYTQVS